MDVFSCVFSGTAAGLLPIGVLLYFILKKRRLAFPYIAGMLTFFVFQFLIRIPALEYLGTQAWFVFYFKEHDWLYGLFLAFTAGVFEEIGRLIVMKLFLKSRKDVCSGLAFGVGHWGIEAILFCGINAWAYLFTYGGSFIVGPASMMAGGIERLIVLPGHVAMTMMVYKGIVYKKPGYIILAILVHTFLDFTIVPARIFGLDMWIIEGMLFLVNLILLGYTVWTVRHWELARGV